MGITGDTQWLTTAGLCFLQVLKGWGRAGYGAQGDRVSGRGHREGAARGKPPGRGCGIKAGPPPPEAHPGRAQSLEAVHGGSPPGKEQGWGAGRMLHPRIRWAKGYVAKLKRMVHLRKKTVSAPSQTHQAKPPQIQGESVKSQSQWEAVIPLSQNLTSQEGNKETFRIQIRINEPGSV